MEVEVVLGGLCPEGVFSVTPSGSCPPWAYAPEWLLAQALRHDAGLRRPGRLAALVRLAPGPHTIWKAAAVEPEDWWEVLGVALYTAEPSQCSSVQLLPFAPAVSSLAAYGQREACLYAEPLSSEFLASLVHALGSSGTERLVLVNAHRAVLWHKMRVRGLGGYLSAARVGLPRVMRMRALAESEVDYRENEATGAAPGEFAPLQARDRDLLALAFGENREIAYSLLSEVEASGGVVSYRGFIDSAASMGPGAREVARRLVLFGYVVLRQAQVEVTAKATYALAGK